MTGRASRSWWSRAMLGLRSTRGGRPLVSEYDGRQFVGIDLHRRRTVIVRHTESGEQLDCVRITNDGEAGSVLPRLSHSRC
jgi:hypothetical protein